MTRIKTVDSFVKSSPLHPHGQDHVAAKPYCMTVCDGCGSVETAGLGSSLLARAVNQWYDPNIVSQHVQNALRLARTALECVDPDTQMETLYSTVVTAVLFEKVWHVNIFGDGIVAYKKKGYNWVWKEVSFKQNSPPYPVYTQLKPLEQSWREIEDNQSRTWTTRFDNETRCCVEDLYEYSTLDDLSKPSFNLVLPEDDLEYLIISSDGVGRLNEISPETGPFYPFDQVSRFVSGGGEFLKRRMNKILKPLSDKVLPDDIGIAAVSYTEH